MRYLYKVIGKRKGRFTDNLREIARQKNVQSIVDKEEDGWISCYVENKDGLKEKFWVCNSADQDRDSILLERFKSACNDVQVPYNKLQ